jgi:integrative and conjugative element protein (TIGR02256 family)
MHYPLIKMCDERAADCYGTNEDGGILLGAYRGPHLEVLDFTESGPDDVREHACFLRQDTLHQERALALWAKSGQTVTFVGEWHTHPDGKPNPSRIDKDSWSRLAKHMAMPMVFIVIAPLEWRAFLIGPSWWRRFPRRLHREETGTLGITFRRNAP